MGHPILPLDGYVSHTVWMEPPAAMHLALTQQMGMPLGHYFGD